MAAAVILMLVITQLLITAAVLGTAVDQDTTVGRVDALRAFYAAEAGISMSVRELMVGADEDGDGVIGSVSDDGDSGNDPSLVGGTSLTARITVGEPSVVMSCGRSGGARQAIELNAQ